MFDLVNLETFLLPAPCSPVDVYAYLSFWKPNVFAHVRTCPLTHDLGRLTCLVSSQGPSSAHYPVGMPDALEI